MYPVSIRASIVAHLSDPALRRRLVAQATRILRADTEAEDCVQDAACSALRAADTCLSTDRVVPWLHQIVANTCRMRLRAARRRRRGGGVTHIELDEASLPSQQRTPELELLGKELMQQLTRSVARLRAPDAEVLRQSVDGVPLAEIAAEAELTASALKSRLFRARRNVSRWLTPSDVRLSAVA